MGVMHYENEEWCKILNKIDLPVQNWHEEFNKCLPEHSKILKICTLFAKYIMFQLKKYRGVIFNGTQDRYKVWRETDLCLQKLTWKKLEPWWHPFFWSWKCMGFKIYREVICHDNEEWCKNWRGIDLSVQNWYDEFDEFWPKKSKISKICYLMGFFWTKYIMFELKKYRGFCLIALNIDATFEGKLTSGFKNDTRNLANFHQSMFDSLKIGTLMGSFYPK